MKKGIVTKALGQKYSVKEVDKDKIISCFIRTRLKKENPDLVSPVAVGDYVKFSEKNKVIEGVFPRESKFSRRATGSWGSHKEQIIAANIDQVVISFSADNPMPNNRLIDRFLLAAEASELEITICFNKWDLANPYTERLVQLYESIGYRVLQTSAVEDLGLEALKQVLQENSSVIMGPSGVGKSTILNKIQPQLNLKSQEVSMRTGKGKHTTTFAELFYLDFGGMIIDTPGLRELALYGVTKLELSWLFPEMREPMEDCKFSDCLHKDEPQCGVKREVEKKNIDILRYESYLKLLETISEPIRF